VKQWLPIRALQLVLVVFAVTAAVHAQSLYLVSVNLAAGVKTDWIRKQPITLTLKESSSRPTDFHIRVFVGSLQNQLAKTHNKDKDGCVDFDTSILFVDVQDTTIHVPSLDDVAWLEHVNATPPFRSRKLVFVFEAGDQPTNSKLRLHWTQVDGYFKHALEITLNPRDEDEQASTKQVEAALTNYANYVRQAAASDGAGNIPTAVVPIEPCYHMIRQRESDSSSTPKSALQEVALLEPLPCASIADTLPEPGE
jgi:hypothetical protein